MERKERFLNGKWKPAVFLCIALWFCFVRSCWADLDERGFEFYALGEIHGQQGWSKAFYGEVEVTQEAETGNRFVMFKNGSSRIVKRILATTSDKVVITLDFLPGSRDISGRLYFDQVRIGGVLALRFIEGGLHILEAGADMSRPVPDTNTGIKFNVHDWNHFELKLDFQAHEYEVFMNKESVGTYEMLTSDVTRIDQLNFFGGGRDAISYLDNLRITSTTD